MYTREYVQQIASIMNATSDDKQKKMVLLSAKETLEQNGASSIELTVFLNELHLVFNNQSPSIWEDNYRVLSDIINEFTQTTEKPITKPTKPPQPAPDTDINRDTKEDKKPK